MSNRYIAAGLLADLILGEDIICVTPGYGEARDILEAVAEALPERVGPVVTRANGNLSIKVKNGGRLRVTAASSSAARGFTADVLVVTKWDALSEEAKQSIVPVLAATNGELIRF